MIKKIGVFVVLSVVAALLLGSIAPRTKIINANAMQSNKLSKQCKDILKKVSDKSEGSESHHTCDIELSRDSPLIQLVETLCPC